MTRKEDFFNLYNKYKDDTNFMVIGIEMPSLESHELIVNHKSNFEEKMKYYRLQLTKKLKRHLKK